MLAIKQEVGEHTEAWVHEEGLLEVEASAGNCLHSGSDYAEGIAGPNRSQISCLWH